MLIDGNINESQAWDVYIYHEDISVKMEEYNELRKIEIIVS